MTPPCIVLFLLISFVVGKLEGQCTSSVCPPFNKNRPDNRCSSLQWDAVTKLLNQFEVQRAALDAQKEAVKKTLQQTQRTLHEQYQNEMSTLREAVDSLHERILMDSQFLISSINNITQRLEQQERILESINTDRQLPKKSFEVHGMQTTTTKMQRYEVSTISGMAPQCSPLIRLADGGSNFGRLEVFHNGEWGTVCDDDFDNNDAAAFCRALGLPWRNALSRTTSSFGPATGMIWLDNVECPVSETNCPLLLCTHRGWGIHDCSHREDVGITCQ